MPRATSLPAKPVSALRRRESAAAGFQPIIDPASSVPAGRQVYIQLRDGIVAGRLKASHRLPSTRTASSEWALSRGLVAEAYDMLIAEGYAQGRRGSGTFVADSLPRPALKGDRAAGASAPESRRPPSLAARQVIQLEPGLPAQIAFATGRVTHDARTAGLLRKLALRHVEFRRDGYRDPQGEPGLREAICTHLVASRGLRCRPEQIIVTTGTQQALDLAIRTLLSPGETAFVEDPCYPPTRQALALNGAAVVGVPVDGEGMRLDALARPEDRAPALIFVTPSHQYPTGAVLSLRRRLALLAFAARHDCWIVEDDYDSEFRYDGRAITSLQGLDGGRRVIYSGSFSKALLPGFRVGYLVVPADLVPAFRAVRAAADRFSAPFQQQVLADFLNEGYFPGHLRRLRERYRLARDHLVALLRDQVPDHLAVTSPDQGVHLLAQGTGSWSDDRAFARTALAAGVVVTPVSPMHIAVPPTPRLLLGLSGLEPEDAEIATRRLVQAFDVYLRVPRDGR